MKNHKISLSIKGDNFILPNGKRIRIAILENIFFSKTPVLLNKKEQEILRDFLKENNFKKTELVNIFAREVLF